MLFLDVFDIYISNVVPSGAAYAVFATRYLAG